jgi:peptidoglycan/LPS O-acetylase OafA/YrhL
VVTTGESVALQGSEGGDASEHLSGASGRLRGLDGLRGLALVPVLLFHLWPRFLPGGLVGLPVFFALSGFVITRGLLGEVQRHSTVDLRAFFARRLRRLWPASTAVLALITVVWLLMAWMTRSISIDIGSAFFEVANWRFLLTGTAYGAHEASPVAHFWSLGIEEQVYLVVPVVVWALRRRPRLLLAAFAVFIAASLLCTVAADGDPTVVYYSTFTRCAEFFIGSILAVAVHGRATSPRRDLLGHVLGVLGFLALGAMIWLGFATSLGTEAYYRGGLTGLAVLAAVVIVAGIWSPSMVRGLGVRPLVWIGSISYGVYLIHWPVHIALLHTGVPLWVQPWLVLLISFTVAPLSLRFFEDPIRLRRVSMRRLAPWAIALSAVVLIGCLVGTTRPAPASEIDFAAAQRRFEQATADGAAARPIDPTAPVGTADHPVTVEVFGDSTALMLASDVGADDPRIRDLGGWARVWCPLGRGGEVRGESGGGDDPQRPSMPFFEFCDWTTNWPDAVRAAGGVDVAVVLTGNWDASGRRIPALGPGFRTVGDPLYDRWLRGEIAGAADALHAAGAAQVAWLTLPPKLDEGPNPRFEQYTTMISEVAATRPWMRIVDYAGHMAAEPANRSMRPDGSHLDEAGATRLWTTWLNDQILAIAQHPRDGGGAS